jgi:HK97 family phage major capsid protein
MNKILELREKRAKLWEDTKAFLDSKRDENGILSNDHTEQYEKMEKDVVNLGKEIERLERQSQIELELSKATSEPIRNNPDNSITGDLTGRKSKEYMDAFWNLMKNKNMYNVQNALQIGTDSEGGYLAPDEFEKKLIQALNDVNIMRELATIINTSHGDKKIPVVASKGTASWTDEEANSNESDDAFGQVTLGAHKVSTLIKVSEELVNDSVFNLQAYIISEFARRIGTAEEAAFVNGNGTGKPTGVFGSADLGITTAVNNAITFDEVIDLYHSLKRAIQKEGFMDYKRYNHQSC